MTCGSITWPQVTLGTILDPLVELNARARVAAAQDTGDADGDDASVTSQTSQHTYTVEQVRFQRHVSDFVKLNDFSQVGETDDASETSSMGSDFAGSKTQLLAQVAQVLVSRSC